MSGLAERVKEAREAAGISQSELARRIGIKPQSVQSIESGGSKGSRHIVALAAALGREPEWLQFGDAPAPPADGLRAAIRSFMAARGLTVSGWCRHAGRPESTLRNFLSGQSDTMTYETFAALAGAAGATVAQITGEAPTSGATQLGNGSPPGARLILEIRQEVTPDQAKRIFEILNEGKT